MSGIWLHVSEDIEKFSTDVDCNEDILCSSANLRATSLLLKCELAILIKFLQTVAMNGRIELSADLCSNLSTCSKLYMSANKSSRPLLRVEGHLLYVQYCAVQHLYRTIHGVTEFRARGYRHLEIAEILIEEYPDLTATAAKDLEITETMLRDGVLVSPIREKD